MVVSGSTDSITYSKIQWGTASQAAGNFDILNKTGGGSLTLSYNVIDGNAQTFGSGAAAQSTMINVNGGVTGTLTLTYNLIENFNQHVIEDQANHTVVYKYNLVYNGGSGATGQHLNYQQWGNNSGTATMTDMFNTTYQPTTPTSGGEGFQTYSNGSGHQVYTFAYNTMVYGPGGEGLAHLSANSTGSSTTVTGSAYGNYIDKQGGGSFFYPDSNACPNGTHANTYGAACSSGKASNINMATGAVITTTP